MLMDNKLRVLMIGAHPDDCEFETGGLAVLYSRLGHTVKFISVTNGSTGHHILKEAEVAAIRKAEHAASCELAGLQSEVLDIRSNKLEADIETREKIITLIREFNPDLIFTHRLNDYHPDHRRTAMLVQDSSYAIRVPNVCPLVKCMDRAPVILYMIDSFKKPTEFSPEIVIDIDPVLKTKVKMLDCHKSQMYEWLPWINREQDVPSAAPEAEAERLDWLYKKQSARDARTADRFRSLLVNKYGSEKGSRIKCCEAFEISEYGGQISMEDIDKYFSF
jgi:LmbE family N-acetylglucosaminyl deacetylase